MGLLSSKSRNYVGVDIGSTSVKVVELTLNQGRPRLVTYGYSERRGDSIVESSDTQLKETAELIQKVMKQAKTTSDRVITALPSYSVFSSVLNFPLSITDKDLPSAIKWEAKKVIPLPIEEMSLSWNKLSEIKEEDAPEKADEKDEKKKDKKKIHTRGKKSKKGSQKILLTGAPNALVKKYVSIFKLTNLKLVSLETESFALVRSLIGNDQSPSLIVNFGSVSTSISIVENAIPVLNRSIDMGGKNITTLIAQSLNISEERATHFKQDVGLAKVGEGNIPRMIEQALAPIVNEIRYTVNAWQNQSGGQVTKLILTGGSANLPNLNTFLSKELELRAFLGDPWARVIYPEELKPVLNEVGSKLAVAIGLAMRNLV
jgi:type IV pilus assembly protein PilM